MDPAATDSAALHDGRATPMERARHRRRQWRAIAGASLLIGWNSAAFDRTADSDPPVVSSGVAGATADFGRAEIVSHLQERNPRLGRGRAERIADAVLRCSKTQDDVPELTPRLILSVMFQESSAQPHAVSPKGAIGLMQVMPSVYRRLDLPGGLANLETNIEAGCMVLADNMRRLGRERGISSYFWGNQIRNDIYLNGVETIHRTLNEVPAPESGQDRG